MRQWIDNEGREFWESRVAGVSFPNDDGVSRQQILQSLDKDYGNVGDIPAELEPFLYEGSPAYYVVCSDQIIGVLPAAVASDLAAREAGGWFVRAIGIRIFGGPDSDVDEDDEEDLHGRPKLYGAKVKILLLAPDFRSQSYGSSQKQADEQERIERVVSSHQKARRVIVIIAVSLCCLVAIVGFAVRLLRTFF